ncbi:MAG: hypothetical protein OXO52_17485 [Rhodospirillales bacterium]|nr:hypothetical protein [Rhodospirillales bacterium]MDE0379202.1 hypothetical protein [Rhodospirillales bacterium]
MKTTVELPDTLFRQSKALAAARGVTMRRFFTEALEEKLRRSVGYGSGESEEPPWMAGFGALSDIRDENRRVMELIEDEFERLSPEDVT